MSVIIKQIKRAFNKAIKSEFAIIVDIEYEELLSPSELWDSENSIINRYENVRVLYDNIDDLNIKKYPYADIKIGKTIFFVPLDYNLINKKNIKVIHNERIYRIAYAIPHQPLGNSYLCQILVQE